MMPIVANLPGVPKATGIPPATAAPTPPPVKQVVVCRFQIDAALGTETNLYDPNKQNNALTRTVRVDVPLK